jgi:LemA protein
LAKGTWIALGVVGAIVLVALGAVGSAVGTYNSLVNEREQVDAQAKQVDVAYQREFRLVPQLVSLAESYLKNETDVQAKIAQLRSGAPPPGDLAASDAYAQRVTDARAIVIKVVNENYPDLKGSQLYRDTMNEVINSENKVAMEKVRYNDQAQGYNAHRQRCCLPLLVAGSLGFAPRDYIGYKDRPNQSDFPANQTL